MMKAKKKKKEPIRKQQENELNTKYYNRDHNQQVKFTC